MSPVCLYCSLLCDRACSVKARRSSRRLKYNGMWWAVLLVFKYIVPRRLKSELLVPAWTTIQDLSCLPSGALHFLWVLECSQEPGASAIRAEAGCEIHAECPPAWGQLSGSAPFSFALISLFLSQHSGRKPGGGRKRPPAMTNVTRPQ